MDIKLPQYNPSKVQELFEALGYSLWMIQSLELSLCNYLVFAHRISTDTAVGQVQNIFEKHTKKTLGNLLSDLKRDDNFFSESVINKLEAILVDRNWLVHKIYALNQSHMFSDLKAVKLISKIRNIGDEAIKLSKLISERTTVVITSEKGFFSKEESDRKTQEVIDSWAKER